jgi:hypothetical protein
MLACGKTTSQHIRIINLLLEHHKNVNHISVWKWTALMWAATGGQSLDIIQRLVQTSKEQQQLLVKKKSNISNDNHDNNIEDEDDEHKIDEEKENFVDMINVVSVQGDTAIQKAVEYGHKEIVLYLIAENANYDCNQLIAVALNHGHVTIAYELFLQEGGDNQSFLHFHNIFPTQESKNHFLFKFSTATSQQLQEIAILAGNYIFFFHLYLELLQNLPSSTVLLNKHFRSLLKTWNSSHRFTDLDLMYNLIILAGTLKNAQYSHPHEQQDLIERYEQTLVMIDRLLNMDCFDDTNNLYLALCYQTLIHQQYRYRDRIVEQAQAYRDGALREAVQLQIKPMFSSSHINTYVNQLFWSCLRQEFCPSLSIVYQFPLARFWCFLSQTQTISFPMTNILCLNSNRIYLRFSPAGKDIIIIIIIIITIIIITIHMVIIVIANRDVFRRRNVEINLFNFNCNYGKRTIERAPSFSCFLFNINHDNIIMVFIYIGFFISWI